MHHQISLTLATAHLQARTKENLQRMQLEERSKARMGIEKRRQRRQELRDAREARRRNFVWTEELEAEFMRAVVKMKGQGSPYSVLVEMQKSQVGSNGLCMKQIKMKWRQLLPFRERLKKFYRRDSEQRAKRLREIMVDKLPKMCAEVPTVNLSPKKDMLETEMSERCRFEWTADVT